MSAARILAVGHSNRTLDELLQLLAAQGVRAVLDVRSLRGSRAVPLVRRGGPGPRAAPRGDLLPQL